MRQPLPPVIRRESIVALLAARRAAYQARNPEWINDPSDPASEPIDAVADVEYRVMQRWNTGVTQLSAATAEGGNLDALAANIGLARRGNEVDEVLRARIVAHQLGANIATMPALLAACLAQPGILDAYSQEPDNGQDFTVYVRTSGDSTAAQAAQRTALHGYLNDRDRKLAGWSYTVTESTATRIYAVVDVSFDSNIVSLSILRAAVEAGVRAYFDGLGINDAVHVNRIVAVAISAGALNVTVNLGTAAAPTGTVDLPAVASGHYYVDADDYDSDVAFTFRDIV